MTPERWEKLCKDNGIMMFHVCHAFDSDIANWAADGAAMGFTGERIVTFANLRMQQMFVDDEDFREKEELKRLKAKYEK